MTQKTKQYELFLLGRKALKFCEKHLFYRSPCTYCFRIPCFLLSSFKFSSSVVIHLAVVVFDQTKGGSKIDRMSYMSTVQYKFTMHLK